MSEINRFIPITDIQESRIRSSVKLPYNMERQVGIDTQYLQTLIQIAGIKHVRIETYDNEANRPQVQIVGINRDGSAIAGQAKTKTISTHSENLTNDQPSPFTTSKHYSWPSLKIELNPNEMRERMLNSTGNNYKELKNSTGWSNEINKAIKQAVRKAGKKNLMETTPTLIDGIWMFALSFSFSSFLLSKFTDPSGLLFHYSLRYLSSTFVRYFENFKQGEGYRSSLLPGYELDRLALLQLYSRIKPLVVPIEKI